MKTRTFLLALLSLLIPAVSSAATTSDLVPTQCTIGDRLVFGPISSVGFIFDVGVSVTPEAKAYIKTATRPLRKVASLVPIIQARKGHKVQSP